MHDEACPTYEDMINNHKVGHDFILKEFGVKPRIGWQVDPFGHSSANVRLFAEMGFDAWFFARIDSGEERDFCSNGNKKHEWVHFPNGDRLGDDLRIFTHDMFGNYYGPLYFDINDAGDNNVDAMIVDKKSLSFNAPAMAQRVLDQV